MKKVIIYIGILILIVGIAGCKKTTNISNVPTKPNALTTPVASLSLPNANVLVLDCVSDPVLKEVSMNLSVT